MAEEFDEIVAAAARIAEEVRYAKQGASVRYELYAFPASICSEKVRGCLIAAKVDFIERRLDYLRAQNYEAAYVRLRRLGGGTVMDASRVDWDGSTSVATHGVDPLVVPTLVDLERRKVVVDSRAIMEYIDETGVLGFGDPLVQKHLDLVDNFPHLSILYGRQAPDRRPWFIRRQMVQAFQGRRQLELQTLYRDKAPDDLKPLYDAKLAKTSLAWSRFADSTTTDGGFEAARAALRTLDADLPSFRGFTAADVAWFSTLFRLQAFGCLDTLAAGLDNVQPYFLRLQAVPALQEAVMADNIPSLALVPIAYTHLGLRSALKYALLYAVVSVHTVILGAYLRWFAPPPPPSLSRRTGPE